jgi:hypothetical protein
MHTFGFWHEEPGENYHDKTKQSVNKICSEALHAECGEHAGRDFSHNKIEQLLTGCSHSYLQASHTGCWYFLRMLLVPQNEFPGREVDLTEQYIHTARP